jgi:oxygen-dependent protoporphyrinogen oxidase
VSDATLSPVVIVGGGIAGLAVAYELTRLRVPFVLYEGDDRLGGVIRTERVDGFTIDLGPDSLLVQKPAALELCEELGLGSRLFPTQLPRTAFILRGGRLNPLPEASVLGIPTRLLPLATTRLFSPWGKLRMALDLAIPGARSTDDESIASFIGRRFGREAVTYLAEPLFAGIHSGDVDRLSMKALFPRMLEAERRHGSLIRAFQKMPRGSGGDGAFRSLPHGLEELVRAVVGTLPHDSVVTGARVVAVERGSPFSVRLASGTSVDASQVVLAVPAFAAATIVQGLDGELATACHEIPYASTATVALAYPARSVRHPLDGSGFVVPRAEPECRLLAASWVSSKWPGRAPADVVLLRAFLGGARDPDVLREGDDALVRMSHDALSRILGIGAEPLLTRLQRWPNANAQHEVGHLDRMDGIERRLRALPGLSVTGSGFRGVGIPDCIADGRAVARSVAEAHAR